MIRTMSWLVRRELWENRGGLITGQWVAGLVLLAFLLMALVWTLVASGQLSAQIGVGVDLGAMLRAIEHADPKTIAPFLDGLLFANASLHFFVAYAVVFFYCLSALYDDRRDRSVLFWKSLPITDLDTVLSKLLVAAVVAPLIAWGMALLVNLLALILLTLFVLLQGGNPWRLIWAPVGLIQLSASTLLGLLIVTIWALPAYSWLLLASAWARSKPFLWAIVPLLVTGLLLSWFQLLRAFALPSGAFWEHVVLRLLLWPASAARHFSAPLSLIEQGGVELKPIGIADFGRLLTDPGTWIGVIAAAMMIALAVALRRYRDDS